MSGGLLVGIDVRVGEVRDRLRLCQPILAFGDDAQVFLARRLDWTREDEATGRRLTPVDADDIATFGTVVPTEARVPIEPGVGVVVVGGDFYDAIQELGSDPQDGVPLRRLGAYPCWFGLADVSRFDRYRARMGDVAVLAVDGELGMALASDTGMSDRGRLAAHVLRKCQRRRTDVAVRDIAIALVDGEPDMIRRGLTRYSMELGESREALEALAGDHLRLVARQRERSRQRRPQVHSKRPPTRHRQPGVNDQAKATPAFRMHPIDMSSDKVVSDHASLRPRRKLARTTKEFVPRDQLERIGAR